MRIEAELITHSSTMPVLHATIEDVLNYHVNDARLTVITKNGRQIIPLVNASVITIEETTE